MFHDEGHDRPDPTGSEMLLIMAFTVIVMGWWALTLPFRNPWVWLVLLIGLFVAGATAGGVGAWEGRYG